MAPPVRATSAAKTPAIKADRNKLVPTSKKKILPPPKPKPKPEPGSEDKLYEKCLGQRDTGHPWALRDLAKLIGHDEEQTLVLCNILIKNFLFQPTTVEDLTRATSTSAFRLRARNAAEKYTTIPDSDAREVYRHIEDAGGAGAWKTALKRKTKLTEARIEKILRGLVTSKHIKQLRNARANAKKTFLLYDVIPGKNLIGGAWHDGGELDESMIDFVALLITDWVKEQSWVLGPVVSHQTVEDTKEQDADVGEDRQVTAGSISKKRKLDTPTNGTSTAPNKEPKLAKTPAPINTKRVDSKSPTLDEVSARNGSFAATHTGRLLLPHPPGYKHYPTVGSITDQLNASGFIKNVSVSTSDMRDLFRILVASGRIERIGSKPKGSYESEETSEIEPVIKREGGDEDAEEQVERQKEIESEAASEGVEPGYEGLYRWVRRPDWEVALDNAKVNNVKAEDEEENNDGEDSGIGLGLGVGNGLTEVPCSKCPVANICSGKGPMGPVACEYYDKWTGSKLSEEWY